MSASIATPDLPAAADAIDLADRVVGKAVRRLASLEGGADEHQVLAYEIAHAAAGVATAKSLIDYGNKGDVEAKITCAFTADMVHDLASKILGREDDWGVERDVLANTHAFLTAFRAPEFLASLADQPGPLHLSSDMEMVADTFDSFAQNVIAPHAEHVHRTNADVPEEIISGMAELGAFGLSVPAEYGGYSEGGDEEYIAMVAATEALSKASLGIGGSLITRPEILTRALVKGGTEEQKQKWLPLLATAEVMPAVAVTEPDYGSDVAGIKVTATPAPGPNGEDGWVINGVKTWCTFGARADALTLLARTDPDRSKTHRGLSLFIVPKPRGDAHGFDLSRRSTGRHVRQDGGPSDRHDRLPRHAQLRDRARGLVGARREPDRHGGRPRQGLLLPDGRVRERPAADRGPRRRRHAGRLRAGARLRREPHGVRTVDQRVPADPGQARTHRRAHPGGPAVQLRGRER